MADERQTWFRTNGANSPSIVIIGYPEEPGDIMADIRKLSELAGDDGKVYLVDPDYSFKLPGNGVTGIPSNVLPVFDDAGRAFSHLLDADAPPCQTLSPFTSALLHLQSTGDWVIYICINPALAEDEFTLASLVKTATFENRLWATARRKNNGKDDRWHAEQPGIFCFDKPFALPDIFNGSSTLMRRRRELPERAKLAMKELIIQGIDCLRAWLRSGFHVPKNKLRGPGWALQTGGVWNTLIISFFGVIPGAPDRFHQDDIFLDGSFRKLMTMATLRVLSNYFVCTFRPGTNIKDFSEATTIDEEDDEVSDPPPPPVFVTAEMMKEIYDAHQTTIATDPGWEDANSAVWASEFLWARIRAAYIANGYVV